MDTVDTLRATICEKYEIDGTQFFTKQSSLTVRLAREEFAYKMRTQLLSTHAKTARFLGIRTERHIQKLIENHCLRLGLPVPSSLIREEEIRRVLETCFGDAALTPFFIKVYKEGFREGYAQGFRTGKRNVRTEARSVSATPIAALPE